MLFRQTEKVREHAKLREQEGGNGDGSLCYGCSQVKEARRWGRLEL